MEITYNGFRKHISKFPSVKSVGGKVTYTITSVKGDLVYFTREGKTEPETISIQEMYNLYCSRPIDMINTYEAKLYISGRVQSPAVAIIHAVYDDTIKNNGSFFGMLRNEFYYKPSEFFSKIGCLALIVIFGGGILLSLIFDKSDRIDVTEYNTECVVNKNSFGVYDSEYLDKIVELRQNQDIVTLEQLRELGVICTLNKGTKAVYLRYLKDGFVVIQPETEFRPVIIESSRLSKAKK